MTPVKRNNYPSVMGFMPSLFGNLFNSTFNDFAGSMQTTAPAMNMTESDKEYKIDIAMPGITKDMAKVELSGENQLSIKVEKKTENEEKSEDSKRWIRREFGFTSYEQTFTLPDDVKKEDIKAAVNDGVLSIELPKQEPAPVPENKIITIE